MCRVHVAELAYLISYPLRLSITFKITAIISPLHNNEVSDINFMITAREFFYFVFTHKLSTTSIANNVNFINYATEMVYTQDVLHHHGIGLVSNFVHT